MVQMMPNWPAWGAQRGAGGALCWELSWLRQQGRMQSLASFSPLYRYRMLLIQAAGKILPVQAVLNSSQPCQKKLSDS